MAVLVKNCCLFSRWRAMEWSYFLCRNCCTSAAPNPSPSKDLQPPAEALESINKYRFYKSRILRQNRRDPELEKKARLKELCVPLEDVRCEWMGTRGRGIEQLKRAGEHSHIFQDLYGVSFHPQGFMTVSYSDIHRVTWGQVIPAKHTLAPPTVTLPRPLYPASQWGRYATQPSQRWSKANFVTLTLTNPDGHLLDSSQELIHWMIANVPVEKGQSDRWKLPTEGHTVFPYLSPVPPNGTGIHRFIFTLYTHTHPLHTNHTKVGVAKDDWLHQRTFSSARFLADNANVDIGLRPFTFCYFQTYWDSSVRHTYKHILKYPEPVYGLEKRISVRKLRQREVRAVRQAKYTCL